MIIGLENQFLVFLRVAVLLRFYCILFIVSVKPVFDPSVIQAVFDIMEGASQLINLTARANPVNCTYSLMRNGVPLSLPWDVSSFTLELGVLTVSGISRDDGGLYTVMAINTEGSTKYNFSINVQCE